MLFFFCFVFSLMRGGRIKIPQLVGHHFPFSETPFKMVFRWRADDGPTLNAGLKFGSFVIFKGIRQVLLINPIFL